MFLSLLLRQQTRGLRVPKTTSASFFSTLSQLASLASADRSTLSSRSLGRPSCQSTSCSLPTLMASSCSASSTATARSLTNVPAHHFHVSCHRSTLRHFSSGNDNESNDKKDEETPPTTTENDSNFFLSDEDSLPHPPSYIRDATTGKWTGKIHDELTTEDRKLLKMDDDSQSNELMNRLEQKWQAAEEESEEENTVDDGLGRLSKEHTRVAHRIQEQQLALGTIGRDPSTTNKDDQPTNANDDDISSALTPREYQALKTYARNEHNLHPNDFAKLTNPKAGGDPDLIPHADISSGGEGSTSSSQFFDADLDLAYLNPKWNKMAFRDSKSPYGGGSELMDDPFADLLPSNLNPKRKVNRKNAKLLPRRVLHHNNLMLLRRYTTPGGKIMNRVQSRLGAKDQRKIAKLVKRARHLGLIPHLGQWKFEDHGNLHEEGLKECNDGNAESDVGKRDWEVELEKRGLWPLASEMEFFKKWSDMDRVMESMGPKRKEELEDLLSWGSPEWRKRQEAKKKQQEEGS